MMLLNSDGKVMQRWVWLAAAISFLVSIPIIWLYQSFGRQPQGIMACLSVSVLVIFSMQFPKYIGKPWLYSCVVFLAIVYFGLALLLPNQLPRQAPTSLVLWPVVLVTIGIDALVLRIFSTIFGSE